MRSLRGGAAIGALLLPLLSALWPSTAPAQVSVHVGVDFSSYPRLARVPGYPVYYSPGAPANLFFYDGLYWLYLDDGWYASTWYNGPWSWVDPFDVPLFVLRVPVRYYVVPPPYFRGWRGEAPPRWGEHWGADWDRRRPDWDRWDRRHTPPPAPLPVYQRAYGADRYPSPEEQRRLQQRQYHYRPREPVAQTQLHAPVPAAAQPRPPAAAAPEPKVERPRMEPPSRPVDATPPRQRGGFQGERERDRGDRDRGDRERPRTPAPSEAPRAVPAPPQPHPAPPQAMPMPRPMPPHAAEPPRPVAPPAIPHERPREAGQGGGGHGPGRGPERGHEQREERGRDR